MRKVQEAYLSIQIERALTKEQIFSLYGNQIYLGHGMYGFEAGAQFYFGKHARDLTLTEAALLAGLPKGPAAYSPLLNPEKALRRRNLVLTEMEADKAISPSQAEQARNALLGLPWPAEQQAHFEALTRESMAAQAAIEAADTMPFEIYRQEYLDPRRLGLHTAAA